MASPDAPVEPTLVVPTLGAPMPAPVVPAVPVLEPVVPLPAIAVPLVFAVLPAFTPAASVGLLPEAIGPGGVAVPRPFWKPYFGVFVPGAVVPATVPVGTVVPGTLTPAAVVPAAVVPGTVVPGTVVPGTAVPVRPASASMPAPAPVAFDDAPAGGSVLGLASGSVRLDPLVAPLVDPLEGSNFGAGAGGTKA